MRTYSLVDPPVGSLCRALQKLPPPILASTAQGARKQLPMTPKHNIGKATQKRKGKKDKLATTLEMSAVTEMSVEFVEKKWGVLKP